VGLIGYLGSVGDFTIQCSVGTSNSATNTDPAQLTINNLSISSGFAAGTTHTLTITLQDTGFTAPAVGQQAAMTSQLSTTAIPTGTGVTFQSFLNGTGGTLLNLTTAPNGVSASDVVQIPSDPYTLANVTKYTVQGQGLGNMLTIQTTGITTVATPAPPGAVLALTGLPFLGLGYWLRRRKRESHLA
jgi:hypothetical protein